MTLAFLDKLADGLAEVICRPWSPIGRRVWIRLDDPRDATLEHATFYGRIRACAAPDGTLTDLLVELDRPFTFGAMEEPLGADTGGVRHRIDATALSVTSPLRPCAKGTEVRWLVSRPCLQWRRTSRMRFSWSAARFVIADSFADAHFECTIGTGRIGLRGDLARLLHR